MLPEIPLPVFTVQGVYSLAKAGRELASDDCRAQIPSGSVVYTDLSVYAKAFRERTERKEAAAH